MDPITERQWKKLAIGDAISFIATQSNNKVYSDEEFLILAGKVYNFLTSSPEEVEKTFEISGGSPFTNPEIKIKVEVGKAE